MKKLKRRDYEQQLEPLQEQLVAMARWLQHGGKRLLVLFEGRDTAGKGGAIDAIREHLNPRQCRVVALPRATEREATQWYFQRLSGSSMRSAKRASCLSWSQHSQYLNSRMPSSTSCCSNAGACRRNALTCASLAKPITFSTPARLYQLRSNSTISLAAGRCGT